MTIWTVHSADGEVYTDEAADAAATITLPELDQMRALRADLAANDGASLVAVKQSGTGAVSRTAQDKLREIVSVLDFGAAGDGATDDSAAFNAAWAAVRAAGGGRLIVPAKHYHFAAQVSFDLSGLSRPSSVVGHGAKITTTGPISGLHLYGSTDVHPVEAAGLSVDHRSNADATAGFTQAGTAHLTWQQCSVYANDGVRTNYAGWRLLHSDPDNDATACFWTRFPGCSIRAENAGSPQIPYGIWLDGAHNATNTDGIAVAGVGIGVRFTKSTGTTLGVGVAQLGGNAVEVRGWFEGVTTVVSVDGGASGDYAPLGLLIRGRMENIGTLLSCTGPTLNHNTVPVIDNIAEINVTTVATVSSGLRYCYLATNNLGPTYIQNARGLRIGNYDNAYDGLTIDPPNIGSGIVVRGIGSTNAAFYGRPAAGGAFEIGVNMTDYYGLAFKGVTGLSASGTASKNLRGSATLSSGSVAVTFPVRNEPDGNYDVFVQGDVGETYGVTGHAAEGFTITSSNGASTATVRWLLVRNG